MLFKWSIESGFSTVFGFDERDLREGDLNIFPTAEKLKKIPNRFFKTDNIARHSLNGVYKSCDITSKLIGRNV